MYRFSEDPAPGKVTGDGFMDAFGGQPGGVRAISAQDIDGSPPSHGQQPSSWPAWHPIDWPALQCRRDRIGGDLLCQVEVAELPNECSQQPAPFLPEYGLDGVGCSLAQR